MKLRHLSGRLGTKEFKRWCEALTEETRKSKAANCQFCWPYCIGASAKSMVSRGRFALSISEEMLKRGKMSLQDIAEDIGLKLSEVEELAGMAMA